MPTYFCERCDGSFVWPWKRHNCATCYAAPGGDNHSCTICGVDFYARWNRDACYNCRPKRQKVDLSAFRERGLLPAGAGSCRVCQAPCQYDFCGSTCRQRAHYLRYEGLSAQDWREIHGGTPLKPGRRPRC